MRKSKLKFNTKNERKSKVFSYDEELKESQTSEHRESCDTIKGIRTNNAFPKEKV